MDRDGALLDPFPHIVARRASPNFPFNATGMPSISIPCGFDPQHLPIGLTISAPQFADSLVLRLAHAFQQATDWHMRHPTGGRA
jgi:Asp-tRNA(Asn)/Glu-tRNA(Gln) amidotransferase A subunit family amidase